MSDTATTPTELLPFPTNAERARRVLAALAPYIVDSGDLETGLTDALADLLHLCDGMDLNFYDRLDSAESHYRAECDPNDDLAPGERLSHETFTFTMPGAPVEDAR